MSNSLTINTPNIVQQNTPLRNVPSGSTAAPDYSVKYVPQDLTDEQKAQARENIGAAAEGGGGTQVQANWNETDTASPAYIQNKPTIPAAQVQSDWNQSDNTAVDYIKNKPSIPYDLTDIYRLEIVVETDMTITCDVQMNCYVLNPASNVATLKQVGNNVSISLKKGINYILPVTRDTSVLSTSAITNIVFSNTTYRIFVHCYVSNFNTGTFIITQSKNINIVWHSGAGPRFVNVHNIGKTVYVMTNNESVRNDPWFVARNADIVFGDYHFNALTLGNSAPLCDNIYVMKARYSEFVTMINNSSATAEIKAAVLALVTQYDFLIETEGTIRMITLPTVPLTMTDENSTVITGDFVAQNVTITPAS